MKPDWATPPGREALGRLVPDLRQLAAIRQVELRDGPEAGVRALVFSTGGGLDFWVLQDRCMDIGLMHWQGTPVAWLHPAGFVNPGLGGAHGDDNKGIERSLGGFLVTCGLDNVRQPRDGLPLHGTLPFTPARLLCCKEDWSGPTPTLYAEAEMTAAHLSGSSFRLRRKISAPVGGGALNITDRVVNIGPEAAQMYILYHINLGFPAIAEGTAISLNGAPKPLQPAGAEAGAAEVRCYPSADASGEHFCVEVQRASSGAWKGISARITGNARALPFMQFWRDARAHRNVLSIEPANCDRNTDGTSRPGTWLAPGQEWSGELKIEFTSP